MLKISAVIVCFNPDKENVISLTDKLVNANTTPIVVDNSTISSLSFDCYERVEYIPLNNNLGIAAAQNIGVKKALSLESDIIIFFDQDSAICAMYETVEGHIDMSKRRMSPMDAKRLERVLAVKQAHDSQGPVPYDVRLKIKDL